MSLALYKHSRARVLLLSLLALVGCSTPKVEDEVKNSEAHCPIELGREGRITDIAPNDSAVVFTMTVDEDSVSLDSTFLSHKIAERLLVRMLTAEQNRPRRLLAAMVAEKKPLQLVFVGTKSGHTLRTAISSTRLVQLVDKQGRAIPNPDRKIRLAATDTLQQTLARTRKNLPRTLRTGIVLKDILIEGGYVAYEMELNGLGLSIDKAQHSPEAVKAELAGLLPGLSECRERCKPACLGLILRFRTNPSKNDTTQRRRTVGILITPDEFSKLKI